MPELPTELFEAMVKKVVKLNERFVPPYESGASLYIRPLLIGTGAQVGVHPANEYLFVIFVSPVGPYFKGGFATNDYVIIREYDRAAPLGTGRYKVGGNYAASLAANKMAHDAGYASEFYLDAKEKKYIDECGAANFFGIKDGKYITPKSSSILPSITNRSLQQLAKDLGMEVEVRPIPEEELSTFEEAGACGTAAVISPIRKIDDLENHKSYVISKDGKPGPWSENSTRTCAPFSMAQNLTCTAGLPLLNKRHIFPLGQTPHMMKRITHLLLALFTLSVLGGLVACNGDKKNLKTRRRNWPNCANWPNSTKGNGKPICRVCKPIWRAEKGIKDDSLVNRLNQEQARAEALLKELQNTKANSSAEILRLKRELATVRAVLRDYIRQVDSLQQANHALIGERDMARADAERVRMENSNIQAENSHLNERVAIAAQLDATGISITPLKKNGKSAKRARTLPALPFHSPSHAT